MLGPCAASVLGAWEPLDDVIMGGRSSSAWQRGVGMGALEQQSGKTFGRWAGTLVTEGGGFCGTVVKVRRWLFVVDSPVGGWLFGVDRSHRWLIVCC